MFQDSEAECVDCPSTWKVEERECRTAGTQTTVILSDDKQVQSIKRRHAQIQTDDVEAPTMSVNDQPLDAQKVVEFLNRIYPLVSQQLTAAASSLAFIGYDVDWTEDLGGLTCLHTLTEPYFASEVGVSAISWNTTGSQIAVAYGHLDHQHLCDHKAGACTWNISRSSVNERKADIVLETNSCVMCIAFHPTLPSLLCAGTYNGEVLVWDISRTDIQLLFGSRSEESHEDPVSEVIWTPDSANSSMKYQIQSVGSGGKILTWALPNQAKKLELVAKHALRAEKSLRRMQGDSDGASQRFGAACASFSGFDRRQFVVGCDNGNLFKCNLGVTLEKPSSKGLRSPDSAASKLSSGKSDSQIRSPITFTFVPQQGPIYGVACSPFHRNAFLACGTDGCLHFYSFLRNRPMFTAEPDHGYLFSVTWSSARPLVCAVGTADGQMLVYDFEASQVQPALTLVGSADKQPVVCVEFNGKRPQYLACGNTNGKAMVYRLPSELSFQRKDEEDHLKAYVA